MNQPPNGGTHSQFPHNRYGGLLDRAKPRLCPPRKDPFNGRKCLPEPRPSHDRAAEQGQAYGSPTQMLVPRRGSWDPGTRLCLCCYSSIFFQLSSFSPFFEKSERGREKRKSRPWPCQPAFVDEVQRQGQKPLSLCIPGRKLRRTAAGSPRGGAEDGHGVPLRRNLPVHEASSHHPSTEHTTAPRVTDPCLPPEGPTGPWAHTRGRKVEGGEHSIGSPGPQQVVRRRGPSARAKPPGTTAEPALAWAGSGDDACHGFAS